MVEEQNLDKGLLYLKSQLVNHQFSNIKDKGEKFGISVQCELDDIKYCILLLNDIYELPLVLIESKVGIYPHISFSKEKFLGSEWKSLCLNIENQYIIYQLTINEKIDITISKLLELINLSDLKVKLEFEKEFAFYWRKSCQTRYESYLGESENENKITLLIPNTNSKDSTVKIFGKKYYRRDYKEYRNETGYFLKILNFSDIYPPCYKPWNVQKVNSIFSSLKYTRFDSQTYKFLKKLYVKGKATIIFQLPLSDNLLIAIKLQFTDTKKEKFLEKIINTDYEMEFIAVDKMNIEHSILRNGEELLNLNNIVMIGCGSLGSYVYREMLNTNVKKFTLVDGDDFRSENLSRHILSEYHININKAQGLQIYSCLDKSVDITAIKEYLTHSNISNVLDCQDSVTNLAVVTVGNEDVQHMINNYIYSAYDKFIPTLFCWLEANGVGVHVLAIVNTEKGCYNCVQEYKRTEDKFIYIRNKEVPIFNNGCGGTFTHYGSNVLLEATSLILKVVKEFSSGIIRENKIYSLKVIEDSEIAKADYYINQKNKLMTCDDIYFEGCKYCGEI